MAKEYSKLLSESTAGNVSINYMQMSSLQYIDSLTEADVVLAQKHSQQHWGKTKPFDQRLEELKELMAFGGQELLRLTGVKYATSSEKGLLSSFKRYGLCLNHPSLGEINGFGFGALFTPEEWRGRGIASEMIKLTLKREKENGSAFALLYSDIGEDYYAQFGFYSLCRNNWSLAVAELPKTTKSISYRELREDEEAWARELYNKQCRSLGMAYVHRSPKAWAFYRKRNSTLRDIVVESKAGKALLNVHKSGQTLTIQELAFEGLPSEFLWATVRLIADSLGCDHLDGWASGPYPNDAKLQPRSEALPMVMPLLEAWKEAIPLTVGVLDYF